LLAGLHDAFMPAVEIERVEGALEQARRREV